MWKYFSWIKVSRGKCTTVCVLCRDSCLQKETVKVHSQYHRNPPAGLATKERRCPGRKIKRGRCGESLKEGAKERERKRGSIRERRKVESVCVFIFRLFCHKLFKGYILPTTHLGTRVKVEEFLLLFSIRPQTHFADSSFFHSPLSFQPSSLHLSPPFAFLHTKLGSCCPADLSLTSISLVLLSLK